MKTTTPTRFGWTLVALVTLTPEVGLAQQTATGTLADLRASVATNRQVYRGGSSPEPIKITMALENTSASPIILNQNFADLLHLRLYFIGPAGPIQATYLYTTDEPEPAPPYVCYVDGQPKQAEPVITLLGNYQYQETLPNAHDFYHLPAGFYTVELRTSVATYPRIEPLCQPNPPNFALLSQQTSSGELRSLPQPFAIVDDSDGDGYCYPLAIDDYCQQASVDCNDHDAGIHDGCNSTTPNNQPPMAEATGPDQPVPLGAQVTLDGSASQDPDGTPLTFAWTQTSGPSVALTGVNTAQASFTPIEIGDYVFALKVSDGQAENTDSVTVKGIYNFTGFFSPIDNPPAFNKMKAGSAAPVKFSLNGDKGLDILNGNPSWRIISCDNNASTGEVEETVTAGGSSLKYDAVSDQYIYVWRTNKQWANSCRLFTVTLKDGTMHQANFNFTK